MAAQIGLAPPKLIEAHPDHTTKFLAQFDWHWLPSAFFATQEVLKVTSRLARPQAESFLYPHKI